jgi:endonuclease-3
VARPRSARGRAREALARLGAARPGTAADLATLDFDGPFQLLVATVLSAQTTDVGVNKVTPALFARYPTPAALAGADPAALEELLRPTGFFRSKARGLLGLAAALVERHDGEVPTSMADLTALPGVGRKTANVVRSVGLGLPGLAVDTHVSRVARRLGLTTTTDPLKAEAELNRLVPAADRGRFSLLLILHGREVCTARRPRCADCNLNDICPSAFRAGEGERSAPKGS